MRVDHRTTRHARLGTAAMVTLALVSGACGTGVPPHPPSGPRIQVEVLEGLDGSGFYPVATNSRGQVAGTIPDPANYYGGGRPVLWDGAAVDLVPGRAGWTTGLNEAGDVVGTYLDPSSPAGASAFLWRDGDTTLIPGAFAFDVNEAGDVLLGRQGTSPTQIAVWSGPGDEVVVPLSPGQASYAMPVDLTDEGRVIGTFADPATGRRVGFSWTDAEGVIVLSGSASLSSQTVAANDDGDVVVNHTDGVRQWASVWSADTGTEADLGSLGGTSTQVGPREAISPLFSAPGTRARHALNRRGQVVASSQRPDGSWGAFLWDDGTLTDLGELPGGCEAVDPAAINSWGRIAGRCTVEGGAGRAVLWQNGRMLDLGPVEEVGQPVGVDRRGRIVAFGLDEQGAYVARRLTTR